MGNLEGGNAKRNMQRAILLSLAMVAVVSAGTTTQTYYTSSSCATEMNTTNVICTSAASACKSQSGATTCKQTSGKCQFVYTIAKPTSAQLSGCQAEVKKADYGKCKDISTSGGSVYAKTTYVCGSAGAVRASLSILALSLFAFFFSGKN